MEVEAFPSAGFFRREALLAKQKQILQLMQYPF